MAKKTSKTAEKTAETVTVTKVTIKDKDFTFGGEGTKRRESWEALIGQRGTRTLEKYLERGGKRKYIKRWEKAGAIALA